MRPADRRALLARLNPGVRTLLAFLAGGATVLAFAPFGIATLAIIGPAVLFMLWLSATPRRAFLEGWSYGLGLMGAGVSWIYNSIEQFGNTGVFLAVVITAGFILLTSLFYGAAGWLSAWGLKQGRGRQWPLPLLFPAIWVLLEWVRGWILTGFPWLALGYSQIDGPLRGYAPLLGVYGVSWAAVFTAALLVMLLERRGRRRLLIPLSIAALWIGGIPLNRIDWTTPAGGPLTVALIQGNVPQHLKWRPGQLVPTLQLYRELTRLHWGTDLVIWPETAVPAFRYRVDEAFLRPLEREAKERGTDLLVGIPLLEKETGRYFNAMLKLGSGRDEYRKRHLVPFGEFMPFRSLLEPLLAWVEIPMSSFSAGGGARPLVRVAGYQVGVSICYEDAFAAEVNQALPDAAFLVNASNDAWFGDSLAPHQHMEIARMRALETGRFLLRSTNTGVSAIVDHKGTVAAASPLFEQDVLSGSLTPMQGMTPFSRIGNWGVISLMLFFVAVSLLARPRDRRVRRH